MMITFDYIIHLLSIRGQSVHAAETVSSNVIERDYLPNTNYGYHEKNRYQEWYLVSLEQTVARLARLEKLFR